MPDRHLPGAEIHLLDDAPMNGDGGARTIWHITWDRNATAAAPADLVPFDDLVGYFTSSGTGEAPHLIWDPFTGRIAQLFSATSRSKSVINAPGGVETNRKGNVCIQIETVFFPYCRVGGRVYATVADTPCEGLDRIMAWLRSWGVPDVWPMGTPDWSSHRDAGVWDTRSGHYGHSQVPENDHTDPGPMPDLFSTPTFQEDDVTPDELLSARLGHAYALPSGYVPTVADALHGSQEADAKLDALRTDLPNLLLSAPMPAYAALPGGYVPTVGEVLNGTKTADDRIAQLATQLAAQTAAITALATQLGRLHGVDTATVVAAVQQAIAQAVVTVHVDVSGSGPANAN